MPLSFLVRGCHVRLSALCYIYRMCSTDDATKVTYVAILHSHVGP